MKKLLIIVLVLLLTGCSTFTYVPLTSEESITIAMTSDIHYIAPSLKEGSTFDDAQVLSDGKLMSKIETITDAFIADMIEAQPDIVIITGDLTYNGEKLSHETLADKLSTLLDNGIQALVIPGNHDILNARAYEFRDDGVYYSEYIDADEFREIYEDYGYSDALSYDEASLSYLYEAKEDLWLFMLDSNTYEDNTGFGPSSVGRIKEETLAWMEELLEEKDPDIEVIIYLHHPLMDVAGASSYVIENEDELQDLVDRYEIVLSISGHVHVQNYKTVDLDNVVHTAFSLSSLAVYDHQYTILEYKDGSYDLEAIDVDVEGYAEANGIDDEFFSDFDTNARAYFKEYSTNRLVGYYVADDISTELSEALFDLQGEFNILEFSGEGYKMRDLLYEHPLYEEIAASTNTVVRSFFTQVSTFDVDATKLHIDRSSMVK